MLCKPNKATDEHHRVPLVVWACRATPNHNNELTYYSYDEETPRPSSSVVFRHTAALLEDLGALTSLSVVHVTCEQQPPKTPQGRLVWNRLVEWLEEKTAATTSDNDDANSSNSSVQLQVHPTPAVTADCLAQLPTILQDLLSSSSTNSSLHIAGDLQLQSSTVIRKTLIFLLRQAGLWSSSSSTCLTTTGGAVTTTTTLHAGVLRRRFLQADRTAAAAMHLWPPAGGVGGATHTGGSKHNQSVWGLLSEPCLTIGGRRVLEAWLRQPSTELDLIGRRQDALAVLWERSVGRDAIRQEGLRLFKGQDLCKLVAALAEYAQEHDGEEKGPPKSTRKALQALYELYTVSSQKLPLLLEQVETALADDDMKSPLLQDEIITPLRQAHSELQRSVDLCAAVLDLDAAPREYLVKPDYKEELQDLQQELQAVQEELEACHAEMNDTWAQISGINNAVRLEETGSNNNNKDLEWQFRLPDTNASKMLQQQLGSKVTVHRLLKNGVYFSTKTLRQLATKKQDLVAEYDRFQAEVALDAAKVAATYRFVLEKAADAAALLDVLAALAHVAAYSPHGYCRPVLTDSDADGVGMELKGARHPCVELQENMEFIPNDVRLKFGESSFLLVTGPNSTFYSGNARMP